MRQLDAICKSIKDSDATLIRKDFVLFERNFTTDVSPFLRDVVARAKREKKGNVVLIAILQ
jgi:hypothetical protein